jgi:hypothetical protein
MLIYHPYLVNFLNLQEQCQRSKTKGEPWLISIAHEQDGYFELYPDEKTRLIEALPSIRFLIEEKSNLLSFVPKKGIQDYLHCETEN